MWRPCPTVSRVSTRKLDVLRATVKGTRFFFSIFLSRQYAQDTPHVAGWMRSRSKGPWVSMRNLILRSYTGKIWYWHNTVAEERPESSAMGDYGHGQRAQNHLVEDCWCRSAVDSPCCATSQDHGSSHGYECAFAEPAYPW